MKLLKAAALSVSVAALSAGAVSAAEIKFSYPVAQDSTMGQTVTKFAELVEEKTGGAVTVRQFPQAQIGNEIQSISSAQGGIVEMAVTTTAGLAAMVPEFNVFQLPFMFGSYEQLDKVSRSPVSQKILDKMEPNNLVGLCFWDYGFRNITNNKRPVTSLDDVQGLRIRTIQNKVYIDALSAMGMNPTPLPFPETFTALETGAIDGNEIANDVTRSTSFYEVQDYLTETQHFTTISVVYASKKFWDGLDASQQDAVRAACAESSDYNREIINASSGETLEFLKEKGMQIDTISAENLQAFRDAVKPVVEEVSAQLDQEIVTEFMAEIEASKSAN
ncbi:MULTISPECIES: TRAP transporter substrate-binding protein DctP [Alphaproteobacteria]|uniref:TRAP transporter substrate-binding protein DctP n=1 Tax=Alphaproteobacteria TaxID=28211 RepID=UPI0019D3B46E|nr:MULTISPECIES: TRAP transporter substrate-binding protein DctP [Alphaproteobacteria]MBY6020498.1 TRAP transporter substrate-binding protein DctP [Nitratireductor sp. DP7N14-4]MBN7755712.1 TRAP transporter substrate-binding protein DctP [Nitratireductor aquimarinus]MBN7763212.1 TRAP transporter substrate-binding protein DctP [Nitratireductor aquibiodomus]MBN7776074.1 TRAP transporter substrate-binding protein DctP [Nitratireductor pacificus]MBN7780738.1 TRAP transporter substrate-binding prot